MRVVAAAALTSAAVAGLMNHPPTASAAVYILQASAGLLLLVGLWTPLAGLLVVLLEGGQLFSQLHDPWTHILLATLGGALTLLGPGAWSVDARRFGWKRIDIGDRQTRLHSSFTPDP
jgi:uncharacterized membrane protein YphA (DoxX/SURF4 family)